MTNESGETLFQPAKIVEINEHQDSQRLDNFLMAQFREFPKSRIYQMIRKGEVRVNKGRAKPTTRLAKGDFVRLPPVKISVKSTIEVPLNEWTNLQSSILFENEDLLVINKPSGMAVHQGSNIPFGIIEILKAHGQHDFYELVQRLDRETSGLLLIAKNGESLRSLQKTDFEKHYLFLTKSHACDILQNQILHVRDPLDTGHRVDGERHVIVDPKGKASETVFSLHQLGTKISIMEAHLLTGRTHQIRVHSAHHGFPIIGDRRYNVEEKDNKPSLARLALHAHTLKFTYKDQLFDFKAPLPKDLLHHFEIINR